MYVYKVEWFINNCCNNDSVPSAAGGKGGNRTKTVQAISVDTLSGR